MTWCHKTNKESLMIPYLFLIRVIQITQTQFLLVNNLNS
jgi:hypothetical protein